MDLSAPRYLRYPFFRGVASRHRTFRASKTRQLRSAETWDSSRPGATFEKNGHRFFIILRKYLVMLLTL